MAETIRLFFSYSHRDQDLRNELEKHLAPLKRANLVTSWHDRLIEPGVEWAKEIDKQLNTADIILLLVSADFLNSDYCWGVEMERALARHDAGEARVIPIILHPCDWEPTSFAKIQALPRDALPISEWPNPAAALADVARGIRVVAQELAGKREDAAAPSGRTGATETAVSGPRVEVVAPVLRPGEVRSNPVDGQLYVWIPPGRFRLGASPDDKGCCDDEKPAHPVTIITGFWIGQTPVTVGAYRKFARATNRPPPEKPEFAQKDDHPVVNVSWEDATAYCKWAGGRLPTEAKWEYAARAGTTAARYGELEQIAWYADNSGRVRLDSTGLWAEDPAWNTYVKKFNENGNGTHPVAVKQANGFRLHDMLGNVWEWCQDWYGPYQRGEQADPQGPVSGDSRVVRGGSWFSFPSDVRVSYRLRYRPENGSIYVGFRCIREVIP